MLDLASQLGDLPAVRGRAPWPGHEYVKGWGVFGLPFDSGHVLALRVFPENDFGPYRTLWHRDPAGNWSIHVDAARLDIACPRYYGPATTSTGFATIELTWTGPSSLRVQANRPSLEWTLTASEPSILRLLNGIGGRLPLWTWRPHALFGVRERLARRLGDDRGGAAAGPWGVGHRPGCLEDSRSRRIRAHQKRNRRSSAGTESPQGLTDAGWTAE